MTYSSIRCPPMAESVTPIGTSLPAASSSSLSFWAKYQHAAPKLNSGGTGAAPRPLDGGTTAAWAAVIHGQAPAAPGQSPELPAISRMLWYLPAEMLARVSLWANALLTGSHMFDFFGCCPESAREGRGQAHARQHWNRKRRASGGCGPASLRRGVDRGGSAGVWGLFHLARAMPHVPEGDVRDVDLAEAAVLGAASASRGDGVVPSGGRRLQQRLPGRVRPADVGALRGVAGLAADKRRAEGLVNGVELGVSHHHGNHPQPSTHPLTHPPTWWVPLSLASVITMETPPPHTHIH